MSRLGQEKDEISRRLEEREREREALRRGKSDLEEQKRLLDRSLDKINKEVCGPVSRGPNVLTDIIPDEPCGVKFTV